MHAVCMRFYTSAAISRLEIKSFSSANILNVNLKMSINAEWTMEWSIYNGKLGQSNQQTSLIGRCKIPTRCNCTACKCLQDPRTAAGKLIQEISQLHAVCM